jgi:Maltokinase N-terminal cap domain
MAIFHLATVTPTKAELIARWAPTQPWGSPAETPMTVIGSYRFDDPDGHVGIESHLVASGDTLLHVPLTYRDAPLDGGGDALITEMEHSVLGTRWVYDGLSDPVFLVMLAAVTMTGQGEALGTATYEGRRYIAPSNVRIQGGGWTLERIPVDGFEPDPAGPADAMTADSTDVVFRNDRFVLTVCRRPVRRPRPPIALTATWDEQPDPVVLAELRER